MKYAKPFDPAPLDNPRLCIEAVPSSCWFSNVRSEVTKAQWDLIRFAVYAAAGNVCEICGGVGKAHAVECHEVWEYLLDETQAGVHVPPVQRLVRMVALCPACHEVKHFGLAQQRGRLVQALAHLAVVNGWPVELAGQHVQQQALLWQQRSLIRWALDLSHLATYGNDAMVRTAMHRKGK